MFQSVRQRVLLIVAATILALALVGASASYSPVFADGDCGGSVCTD